MIEYTHDPEINLIRQVLDEGSLLDALTIGVRPEYFSDSLYGEVWGMIVKHWRTFGRVPDFTTVRDAYPSIEQNLVKARPVEPPSYYAQKILEGYTRQGVAKRMLEVLPRLRDDVSGTIRELRRIISEYDLAHTGRVVQTMSDLGPHRWRLYTSEDVYGIPFPWATLDKATLGMHPGELIGFIGRPGQGKSHMLLKMVLHAWLNKYRPLVVATEMPSVNMMFRLDAQYLKVPYDQFRKRMLTDSVRSRYQSFLMDTPDGDNLMFVDGMGITVGGIATLIERFKPDVLFIDGVYMIEPDASYREDWQKIRHLAKELKSQLAMRYDIPVVFNSQFSRKIGTAVGGKLKKAVEGGLEDIAYGDSLGHYADLVVGISRSSEDLRDRVLTMKVIKGRETADGLTWKVDFDFSRMTFEEVVVKSSDDDDDEHEDKLNAEVDW